MPEVEAVQALVQEIEEYLQQIFDALPFPSQGADLTSYLSSILNSKRPSHSKLRHAFGFPPNSKRAKLLVHILNSPEPSLAPFVRFLAQRVYQLTWRSIYTLHWIEKAWKPEALNKARRLLRLCEPHLLARRPTPADLRPVLDWGTDSGMFRESVVDTQLFAVLRAFPSETIEEDEPAPIPSDGLEELRKRAVTFLHKYLSRALRNKAKLSDSSNAWWALRLGWEADNKFTALLPAFVRKFNRPIIPSRELASQDFAPDIRTELCTRAYTLSNAQAIYENGIELRKTVSQHLEAIIEGIAKKLLGPHSRNLYLASVHYEALRNYLDFVDDQYFMTSIDGKKIKTTTLWVGKFGCGDGITNRQIRELVTHLKSPGTQKAKTLVLIYGPSSVGKSHLVEQLFAEFGQGKNSFEELRLICTQQTNVEAELTALLTKAKTTGLSRPFLFIDEADTKMALSIFPSILKLYETGKLDDAGVELKSFVLFWGGGKFITLKSLQAFLQENRKSASFQKGIDVFNRSKRMELPARLMENPSHKVALGLLRLAEAFPPPVWVDWNVVEALRISPLPGGFRDLKDFPNKLEKASDTVRLVDRPASRWRLRILG